MLLVLRIFYFPSFSYMKISLKHFIPLLLVVALVGCAGTSATTKETDDTEPTAAAVSSTSTGDAASSDDHHAGETDVQPHDDTPASSAAHIDDPNEPAHGHSSSHDDSNEPPHRD